MTLLYDAWLSIQQRYLLVKQVTEAFLSKSDLPAFHPHQGHPWQRPATLSLLVQVRLKDLHRL